MAKSKINCSYCHSEASQKFKCSECKAIFHEDCYEENGGCSILGCNGSAEEKTKESKTKESKTKESKTKQSKTKESKTKQSKTDIKEKKVVSKSGEKSNKVLIFVMIITFLPLGYFASFNNWLYPYLPAVYKEEDVIKANKEGYNKGEEAGYTEGYNKGEEAGYTEGYNKGEEAGYTEGYNKGEAAGRSVGYDSGYDVGYDVGWDTGYDVGWDTGYDSGWSGGRTYGYNIGVTAGCESVFTTLGYTRVVGYSYSFWSGSSYGSYTLNKSSC